MMQRFVSKGVLLLVWSLAAAFARADEKPNILFIFADDMCYDMVGGFGLTDVTTPNLDTLARGGVTFTHASNMGSWTGAVCVASRTMLNTGRFLWRARQLDPKRELAKGRLWSECLRKAGYETYFSGKWHVKVDNAQAFDHSRNVRGGMPNQTKVRYRRSFDPDQPDTWSPSDPKFGGFWKGGKHWSEVLADDAERFLSRAATSDKPFFMYLAFNAVHDPRQSPQRYVDRYPLSRMKLPASFMPLYRPRSPFSPDLDPSEIGAVLEDLKAIGCGKGLRDEKLAPFPRTKYSILVNRREYYAIAEHMDAQIGRILAALERSGKARNTFIIFSADHGLAVGRHGLLGKQNLYEHSVRVPFLIAGPGIPRGEKNPTRIYLQDAMATTLELAGIARPDYVEFHSVLPLLQDRSKAPYEAIYGAYLGLQRSVVWREHKLLLYPKLRTAKLFDLRADPKEMEDLSGDPSKKPLMRQLFGQLLELQERMDDALELRSIYPQLAG